MKNLILKVSETVEKEKTNYTAYSDFHQIAREVLKTDQELGIKWLKWLAEKCGSIVPSLAGTDLDLSRKFMVLHKQILLSAAPYDFDCYPWSWAVYRER